MSEKLMDWNKAIQRIERLLKQSQEISNIYPQALTKFYDADMQQLCQRYYAGERTEELYDAMMDYVG